MITLTNYHTEIDNANNFLNQIIFNIVTKSKETLNCLQYNNVTIEDTLPLEPSPAPSAFAKSKERKHECETCKKSFFSSRHLKAHIKVHLEDRPFKCQICGFATKFKDSLKSHLKSHSDERPWKCEVCEAFFALKT